MTTSKVINNKPTPSGHLDVFTSDTLLDHEDILKYVDLQNARVKNIGSSNCILLSMDKILSFQGNIKQNYF